MVADFARVELAANGLARLGDAAARPGLVFEAGAHGALAGERLAVRPGDHLQLPAREEGEERRRQREQDDEENARRAAARLARREARLPQRLLGVDELGEILADPIHFHLAEAHRVGVACPPERDPGIDDRARIRVEPAQMGFARGPHALHLLGIVGDHRLQRREDLVGPSLLVRFEEQAVLRDEVPTDGGLLIEDLLLREVHVREDGVAVIEPPRVLRHAEDLRTEHDAKHHEEDHWREDRDEQSSREIAIF